MWPLGNLVSGFHFAEEICLSVEMLPWNGFKRLQLFIARQQRQDIQEHLTTFMLGDVLHKNMKWIYFFHITITVVSVVWICRMQPNS